MRSVEVLRLRVRGIDPAVLQRHRGVVDRGIGRDILQDNLDLVRTPALGSSLRPHGQLKGGPRVDLDGVARAGADGDRLAHRLNECGVIGVWRVLPFDITTDSPGCGLRRPRRDRWHRDTEHLLSRRGRQDEALREL